MTCSPMEICSEKEILASQYGVCYVFAGFGYFAFDGVALPRHRACTYVLLALSLKALQLHSVTELKKTWMAFLLSLEVSVDPETLWKIQVCSAGLQECYVCSKQLENYVFFLLDR